MAVSEQAEQKPGDQIFLPYHDVADLCADSRNPLPELLHFSRNFLGRFHVCVLRQIPLEKRSIKLDSRHGVARVGWQTSPSGDVTSRLTVVQRMVLPRESALPDNDRRFR